MIALVMLSLCFAGPVEKASDLLRSGDPAAAVETLLPIAQAGGASAAVHYNLGTAYYRSGDRARAVAHWRFAHQLAPRNADVVHNLALVRGELRGLDVPVSTSAGWREMVSLDEAGAIALATTLAGSLLAVIGFRRRRSVWTGVAFAVAGLAGGTAVVLQQRAEDRHPVAVTIESARVRDAPALDAGERFTLRPGTETQVIHTRGDFVLVQTGTGRRGWVVAAATCIL